MDINRMTERLQQAFLRAQTLATQNQHQEIDDVHIFLALLEDENSLVHSILEKLQLSSNDFKNKLENLLAKKPQVIGSGVEQGKVYITPVLQKVLAEAETQMKLFNDEYLSVEHILLAAINTEQSAAGQVLKNFRVTIQSALEAIKEIRGIRE